MFLNRSYSIIITSILMLLISKVLILRLSLFIGGNASLISEWKLLIIIIPLLFCGLLFRLNNNRIKTNGYFIAMLSLFIMVIQWWVAINYTGQPVKETIIEIVLRYYWIYLLCICIFFKINIINIDILIKTLVIFVLANSILGVIQYLLRDPILSTTFQGKPFVNTIFYKDGISSAYTWLYNLGSQVRAHGLFDSGLTLGLFINFAICIVISFFIGIRKRDVKIPTNYKLVILLFCIIFLTSLYMTLTRNIYVIFLNIVFLYLIMIFFKEKKFLVLKMIYVMEWVFGFIYIYFAEIISEVIAKLFPNLNTQSFLSRINTYNRLENYQNNDLMHFLFGKGVITSREGWVIDNDMLSIGSHIGFLPFVMMQIIYIWVICKCCKYLKINNDKKINNNKFIYLRAFVIFLMTYPIAGTLNYVSYFYFFIAIFAVLVLFSENITKKERK